MDSEKRTDEFDNDKQTDRLENNEIINEEIIYVDDLDDDYLYINKYYFVIFHYNPPCRSTTIRPLLIV